MDFKTTYPDFAPIERQIRRAHAERSVYLAHVIAGFIEATGRGFTKVIDSVGRGLDADRERRIMESDVFVKRSVSRY